MIIKKHSRKKFMIIKKHSRKKSGSNWKRLELPNNTLIAAETIIYCLKTMTLHHQSQMKNLVNTWTPS